MKHEGEAHDDVSRETPKTEETWSALERWLGLSLSLDQRKQLELFGTWLAAEAVRAGGIGPAEVERLHDRHIHDSLAYLRGVAGAGAPSILADRPSLVDVGSGVGLPGIPLAIALPDWDVTLVDRADRRTFLARRAVRVVGLENVTVLTQDAASMQDRFDVVAFRASLPVTEASRLFVDLANPEGIGLFGVSRLPNEPTLPDPPAGVAYDLTSEETEVLDSPFWLLRMRRT